MWSMCGECGFLKDLRNYRLQNDEMTYDERKWLCKDCVFKAEEGGLRVQYMGND